MFQWLSNLFGKKPQAPGPYDGPPVSRTGRQDNDDELLPQREPPEGDDD